MILKFLLPINNALLKHCKHYVNILDKILLEIRKKLFITTMTKKYKYLRKHHHYLYLPQTTKNKNINTSVVYSESAFHLHNPRNCF